MSSIIISPKFSKNNLLEIDLQNNSKQTFVDIKLCFSLVYSIESIKGARIVKQIGRYYELQFDNNPSLSKNFRNLTIKLQNTRIGTYNLSCGPEGIFIINKKEERVDIKVNELIFQKPIHLKEYDIEFAEVICPIIPEPLKINLSESLLCKHNNKFYVSDKEIKKFLTLINPTLNILNLKFDSSEGININFINKAMSEDEYKILIERNKITIFVNSYGGKIYALTSLLHLLFFYKNYIPLGEIHDKPKFKWRGMHLDCARQFHSIEQIKRILLYMSLFKLNRFHWHLTDNEAWRLDLQSFPNLAKNSSFRGYNQIIPPVYGTGYKKSGGYYSKDDVKNLIEFAKHLNIEIMPEIDLPAHSWALIQVMPELFDQSSNTESKDLIAGYKNNTINPALEKTWVFLEKTIKEISGVFSFNTVHVGLDERPKSAWEGSPEILNLIKKNNLSSFEDVQDFYLNKVINLLKVNNKRTAAWNEAALPPYKDIGSSGSAGNIDKNCLIFAWEHAEIASLAVKKGYEVVMCPGQKTYFDMAHNNSTDERGICWAATIEVSEVHDWKPLSAIESQYHNLIIGIQGHLWSETITKNEYIDIMINPRLAALSEVAWSADNRRSWKDFRSALKESMKILSKIGWKFHDF